MSADLLVVLTTFDAESSAQQVARRLVEESLVACAQVDTAPVHSVYRWQDAIESTPEWRVLLKVPPRRLSALRERLLALHPYETPQFVVLGASASAEYLRWVEENCP